MKLSLLLVALFSTSTLLAEAAALPDTSDDTVRGDEESEEEAIRLHEDTIKYFHEPGSHEPGSDGMLGHYDTRYFQRLLSYEEKQDTQVHMVRAYLDVFQTKGIETWIAHGTLLGWWWNGKMLPWDWDIDTQVSESTLGYLATQMNHTFHTYTEATSHNGHGPVTRTYLLDINPHWAERERGDGLNIIDARWIDVHTGLYIDITGLSETHPETLPGFWSCKNLHRYKVTDLYPMRETTFEGVTAKVPYAYDLLLADEYTPDSLVRTEFEGHRWDSASRIWVKQEPLLAES